MSKKVHAKKVKRKNQREITEKMQNGLKVIDNGKLVSIIIPCYNVSDYLLGCFECLKAQTYKNLQIIFVNDGSTDNTEEILNSIKNENGNVEVISCSNCGVANARNLGLTAVKGEFVTFYDPDDVISPIHIQTLVSLIEDNDVDVGVVAFKRVKDTFCCDFQKLGDGKVEIFDRTRGVEQLMSHKKFDVCLWNKIYKTQIIKNNDIKFILSRYGEDTFFNYKYFSVSNGVAYSTRVTCNYVMRSSSLTHERFNVSRLTVYKNLNAIISDSEACGGEFMDYARYMRAAYSCEMLYFINKYDYQNAEHIAIIIDYMREDVVYLKRCKKIATYRRWFIPLVPFVAKMVFRKLLKKLDRETLNVDIEIAEE